MTVTYACRCMTAAATVSVPARVKAQEIGEWLDRVVKPAVADHHRAKSPSCKAL